MTTADNIFANIPTTVRDDDGADYYRAYRAMRDGDAAVVALAPSDASGERPHYVRTDGLRSAGLRGVYYCPRCADRGHARAVHAADLETCHADGWKSATVAAVRAADGDAAARRAQAWLSRWSPADVLSAGCRTCNREDEDWGSASRARECGVECC